MNRIISFFKRVWPFFITLVLWRLSTPFWNPVGILALIPVFFYSFVKPINWFPLFSFFICFLIDYRCNLPLFWTISYCLFYALNGFQNYIDAQHMTNNSIHLFACFIGFVFFILMFSCSSWIGLLHTLWLFVWMCILYTPITALDKWIKK